MPPRGRRSTHSNAVLRSTSGLRRISSPETRRSKARATAWLYALQGVEIRNAFGRQVNNLGINNQRLTGPSCFLYNTRIAFGPVSSVHRVKANAILADMDLQPIAVVLHLVRPTWPDRGLGDDRLTRMDESGRRIERSAALATHTRRHTSDKGRGT
jgi:hypothetical protein